VEDRFGSSAVVRPVTPRAGFGGNRTSRSLTGRAWTPEAAFGVTLAQNIAEAWFKMGSPQLDAADIAGSL